MNTPIDDSAQPAPVGQNGTEDETNSINAFPGGVSLSTNNSLFLGGSDDESLLQHLKELNSQKPLDQQSPDENSAEYSVEPLRRNLLEPVTYTVTATDVTTVDPDDEFCVIEAMPKSEVFPMGLDSPGNSHLDVHALQAKLAKLESTSECIDEMDGLRRSSLSPAQSDVMEVDDMEVDGGKVHNVAVKVATPRTVVSWQFSSQPKGIATGLKYQEREDEPLVDVSFYNSM